MNRYEVAPLRHEPSWLSRDTPVRANRRGYLGIPLCERTVVVISRHWPFAKGCYGVYKNRGLHDACPEMSLPPRSPVQLQPLISRTPVPMGVVREV